MTWVQHCLELSRALAGHALGNLHIEINLACCVVDNHTSFPPSLPPSLTELDASHNQITYLPSSIFKLPELTHLVLSYNLLHHLPGDPEDASAQSTSGE